MPRNLDRRVEALVPIEDTVLQRRLQQIIDVQLADDHLAWRLEPDSTWSKVQGGSGVDTHHVLEDLALGRRDPS
jgi:polyphosphate kinase